MRRLVVTADDFGLSVPVNEAVEIAHRDGILTSASLMVTAPAADDAVERARRAPALGVGLHLVLVDGRPALDPERIPDLVGDDGRFTGDPVRLGLRLFFLPHVERQVEAEMRAQLDRFAATGLAPGHLDGHHHFHQHPTIVGLVARLAPIYGIRTVRVPEEPFLASWRAQREGLARRLLGWLVAVTRFTGMRGRLRRAGVACNDHIFGLHDSGRMTPERVARYLDHLPEGVSELYCHPATRRWEGTDNLPARYLCVDEFRALADASLRARLERAGIARIPFSALGAGAGA